MEAIKLISKKIIEKDKRQKELFRYLILLCLSNLATAFVFSASEEAPLIEAIEEAPPQGLEEITVSAKSFVSHKGDSIKILNQSGHIICQNAIFHQELLGAESFNSLEATKEYSIYLPSSCLAQVLAAQNLKLVPISYQGIKKDGYEIRY